MTNHDDTVTDPVRETGECEPYRAISGDILLDNLLTTLMRIVLENAGAQKGYLLLVRHDELVLAADARVDNQDVVTHIHRDPGVPQAMLPSSIIDHVRRSWDHVLLHDATSANPYSADEYFTRQRPKSVLCFPITEKTRLIGVLYLENDLVPHVFTPDRLAVLKAVAAQAATSLENAVVYEALQDSEERLRLTLEATQIGIFDWNVEQDRWLASPVYYTMLGYEPKYGTEDRTEWMERIHPDDRALVEEKIQAVLDRGASARFSRKYEYEARIRHADGTYRWGHVKGFAIKHDQEGRVTRILGVRTDVTERKRLEDALVFVAQRGWKTAAESFFDALAQFLGEKLEMDYVIIDRLVENSDVAETVALYAKGAIEPNIRYPIKGTPCENVMGRQLCIYPQGVQQLFPEDKLLPAMGVESYIGIPLWDSTGRAMGLIAVMGNKPIAEDAPVTQLLQVVATRAAAELERERSDRLLRAREHEFSTLVANLPDCIVRYDLEGRAVYVNQVFEETLGVDAARMLGTRIGEFHSEWSCETYAQAVDTALASGQNGEIELTVPVPGKEPIVYHMRLIVERDENGEVTSVLAIGRDITERKRAEEEIRKLNQDLEQRVAERTAQLLLARDAAEAANKAKSVFLANMSHELRTPMNAILGFSSLMRRDPQLTGSQRENLDVINRSGEHLLTLIDDVLDIAKIEAGRTQLVIAPFDLGAMVRDVADMMRLRAQEKGLQLLLDQSSEFPRFIKGDEARLRQVLVNLTGNAVKFTEHGGVTIRLRVQPNAPGHLLMEVEDTGPGIAPEDQKRLFKPFMQLAESGAQRGTGLGLAISRQFVELMGGSIGVESTLGKGSVFRVELPVELPGEAEIGAPPFEAEAREVCGLAPGTPSYRILIAEDHPESQMLLVKLMNTIGVDPKVAENGERAVKIFEEWRPHLIWMDRHMPVMDGIEATRRIRELPGGREVKIVAVTASVFKELQHELFEAGMDDFVRKPYRFDEIYHCLARQLGVKYLYRLAAPGTVADTAKALTPAMLASLPAALREELKAALESLDSEKIAAAIRKATEFDAELGRTLEGLAGNFEYPVILKALRAESL